MNKFKNIIIALSIVSLVTFFVHTKSYAQDNNNDKIYKNVILEKKSDNIIYRMTNFVPSLKSSIPKINASALHLKGAFGSGYSVAVLDTGVSASHPFVSGRVIGEACFTYNKSCPNGQNKMVGSGAASPVHWHGTHVAGIVAGKNSDMTGVAPGANIVAVNIFEKDGVVYEESLLSGLEYVLSVKGKYNIVSVNLSLGTSRIWTGTCDTVAPELTKIIHDLYEQNVAVVAATGNSFSHGMANPACISRVVSVAASYGSTDNITDFSNISQYTTFSAPGYQILSSAFESYRFSSGTSMAAPFVAGAIALYASYKPSLSVDQRIVDFKVNCPKSYDFPTKITVCRLDFVGVAGGQTGDTPIPTTTTLPSTSTTVPNPSTPGPNTVPMLNPWAVVNANNTVTVFWNQIENVQQYRVCVNKECPAKWNEYDSSQASATFSLAVNETKLFWVHAMLTNNATNYNTLDSNGIKWADSFRWVTASNRQGISLSTQIGKPRLTSVILYKNGIATASYIDVLYGKSLIDYYNFKCDNNFEVKLPVVSGRTSHTFSFAYSDRSMRYCDMYPVSLNGLIGPKSAVVFVSK